MRMITDKKLTPLKSIRKYCLACSNRPKEVRECQSTDCPLYQYRMGSNPSRSGIGPDKHLENGRFASKLPAQHRFFRLEAARREKLRA